MPTVKDYLAAIGGICGAETEAIVTFRCEEKDTAIANIFKHSIVKKSVSGFMFELEIGQNVDIFRLFSSGRAVFRGVKDKKELNRILGSASSIAQSP